MGKSQWLQGWEWVAREVWEVSIPGYCVEQIPGL